MGPLLASKGAVENAFNGREFHLSRLGQGQVVKLGSDGIVDLCPKVSPVHICLLGLVLELGALSEGKKLDIISRLLGNHVHVPLWERR